MLAAAAVCGWSALLMHRGVANFNDGVRPVVGEWTQGNLDREELSSIAWDLSRNFIIHESPFMAVGSLLLGWPLLLPADIIGSRVRRGAWAFAAGAAWGALLALLVKVVYTALGALPVAVPAPIAAGLSVALWGLAAIPTVACGSQFGARAATVAGAVSAVAWIVADRLSSGAGAGAAALAGLLVLVAWSMVTDRGRSAEEEDWFTPRTERIRGNLGWLAVQGALLGAAARSFALAWNHVDLIALASGHRVTAAALALVMVFAFWPASVTSAMSTGVYQSVGLALCFPVAYLSPNPLLAAALCALVLPGEVLLLERMNHLLHRFPTLRGAAESVRAGYELVIPLSVLAGCVLAVTVLLPGGLGVLGVIALVAVNERYGRTFTLFEAPAVAAIGTGLLANLLLQVGYLPG